MSDFQGDVVLLSTADGGDLFIENNLIIGTGGFETAARLSLMGGNFGDDGTESTRKKSWWGNQLETDEPNRRLISRFQNIMKGLPATPNNLNKAVQAIKDDLSWFISEEIADTINVSGSIPSKNRFEGTVVVLKDGETLADFKFEENWLAQESNRIFEAPAKEPIELVTDTYIDEDRVQYLSGDGAVYISETYISGGE